MRILRFATVLILAMSVCGSGSFFRKDLLTGTKPNIILLIGDDYGYRYFGFMGSEDVLTPSMDTLAEGGTVFTFAHSTASVCRPALRSLLAGFYPYQVAAQRKKMLLDAMRAAGGEETLTQKQKEHLNYEYGRDIVKHLNTLPRLLGNVGYASFQTGKYWEGAFANAGFTEGMSGAIGPITGKKYKGLGAECGGDGLVIGRDTMQPVFDFIDKYREQPFFIWYAPMLPHTPHNPPPELRAIYEDKDLSESAKAYYATCTWFDRGVGELTEYLEKKGLMDNTLLVYISDNGWEQEPKQELKGTSPGSALGGRTGKRSLHETGFRTPVVFRWPGRIRQGVRNDKLMVSMVDIFPTLLEVAGVTPPTDIPGKSLIPALMGSRKPLRDVLISTMDDIRYGERGWLEGIPGVFGKGVYLRTARWHFIRYEDRDVNELYDKEKDPNEENDVAQDHPELVEKFLQRIERWKAEMEQPFQD